MLVDFISIRLTSTIAKHPKILYKLRPITTPSVNLRARKYTHNII